MWIYTLFCPQKMKKNAYWFFGQFGWFSGIGSHFIRNLTNFIPRRSGNIFRRPLQPPTKCASSEFWYHYPTDPNSGVESLKQYRQNFYNQKWRPNNANGPQGAKIWIPRTRRESPITYSDRVYRPRVRFFQKLGPKPRSPSPSIIVVKMNWIFS